MYSQNLKIRWKVRTRKLIWQLFKVFFTKKTCDYKNFETLQCSLSDLCWELEFLVSTPNSSFFISLAYFRTGNLEVLESSDLSIEVSPFSSKRDVLKKFGEDSIATSSDCHYGDLIDSTECVVRNKLPREVISINLNWNFFERIILSHLGSQVLLSIVIFWKLIHGLPFLESTFLISAKNNRLIKYVHSIDNINNIIKRIVVTFFLLLAGWKELCTLSVDFMIIYCNLSSLLHISMTDLIARIITKKNYLHTIKEVLAYVI